MLVRVLYHLSQRVVGEVQIALRGGVSQIVQGQEAVTLCVQQLKRLRETNIMKHLVFKPLINGGNSCKLRMYDTIWS